MKKLLLLTAALVAFGATLAFAAAPGVNLNVAGNCSTLAAGANKTVACDGSVTIGPVGIQGTFRPSVAVPDFAGTSSVLDIGFGVAVPDYWKMQAGECNAGAGIGTVNPGATAPCVTTNIFDGAYSGGGYAQSYPTASRIRFRVDWATGAPVPPSLTVGLLYPAFKMQFDPDNGVNVGCAGCDVPACLVLNQVEVFGFATGEDYVITTQDVKQFITWQGGAVGGQGCPAETPAQNKTWGSVKALYR